MKEPWLTAAKPATSASVAGDSQSDQRTFKFAPAVAMPTGLLTFTM